MQQMASDAQVKSSFLSAFETLPGTIITLLITGAIGGILTTIFQYKSWKETTRQERTASDLNSAYAVLIDTSKRVSNRWYSGRRAVSHLDDDDRVTSWSNYEKAVIDWNEAYNTTLIEIDYKIEGLSGYRLNPSWDRIEGINCDQVVQDQLKPEDEDLNGPQGYFMILHNCFIKVGEKISDLHEGKVKTKEEKDKMIENVKKSLDMIQRHFMDFRRQSITKMTKYRNDKELRSIWQFVLGH
jgi:hypothetical protein